MTKIEYKKCEKLIEEAITTVKQAQKEYDKSEDCQVNCDNEWITEQRKADQHYGYAEGIIQALSVLGFQHDKMKDLSELL